MITKAKQIQLAMTHSYHPRTKHIDVRHRIDKNKICLQYKNKVEMVADIQIKILPKAERRPEKSNGFM